MFVFPFLFLLAFNLSVCNVASFPGAGSAGSRGWLWGRQRASAVSPAVVPAGHLLSGDGDKAKRLLISFQAQQCTL